MERITAFAKGRVQGVGYRYFVSGCAHATGVHGYVKNLPDGTVEMPRGDLAMSAGDNILLVCDEKEYDQVWKSMVR